MDVRTKGASVAVEYKKRTNMVGRDETPGTVSVHSDSRAINLFIRVYDNVREHRGTAKALLTREQAEHVIADLQKALQDSKGFGAP